MSIINSGYKREAFLRTISLHLCGDPRFGEVVECDEKIIYFGGGYWRGRWLKDEAGVVLFNPSVSRAQTLVVEQAMCILNCGKFKS